MRFYKSAMFEGLVVFGGSLCLSLLLLLSCSHPKQWMYSTLGMEPPVAGGKDKLYSTILFHSPDLVIWILHYEGLCKQTNIHMYQEIAIALRFINILNTYRISVAANPHPGSMAACLATAFLQTWRSAGQRRSTRPQVTMQP